MEKQAMTFHSWMGKLREEFVRLGVPGYSDDEESWRPFYDDGYTPTDALLEDMSR